MFVTVGLVEFRLYVNEKDEKLLEEKFRDEDALLKRKVICELGISS